jgi:hypothetical protein
MGDSLLIKHGKKVKFQVLREPKHIFVLDPCFKNKGQGPGMVSHSCNPSYTGGGDWEVKPHLNKVGTVAHAQLLGA